MTANVYLDSVGRKVSGVLSCAYHIMFDEKGRLSLTYKFGTTENHRDFRNLTQLNNFLRECGAGEISPEAVGLVLYFDRAGKYTCPKQDAGFSIIPAGNYFLAYYYAGKNRTEICRGPFDMCHSAVRKYAKNMVRTTSNTKYVVNTVYADKFGATVFDEGNANYLFEQERGQAWNLYSLEGGKRTLMCHGSKKECNAVMFDEINSRRAIQHGIEKAAAVLEAYKATETAIVDGTSALATVNVSRDGTEKEATPAPNIKVITRNKAKTLRQNYLTEDLRELPGTKNPPIQARFKVHFMDNGKWRVSYRDKSQRSFSQIADFEFEDEDFARAYLYLYVGSTFLEFYDIGWFPAPFHDAVYCKRGRKEDGLLEIQKFDGYSWNVIATDTPANLKDFREQRTDTYLDEAMHTCEIGKAHYKEVVISAGILHKLLEFKDKQWVHLKSGTPDEIAGYKSSLASKHVAEVSVREKEVSAKEPAPVLTVKSQATPTGSIVTRPAGRVTPIENVIWEQVKDTTWLHKEDIAEYLTLLASRNRHVGKSPVFDTRLYDRMKQPFYVVDTDWGKQGATPEHIAYGCLKLCVDLSNVQRAFPEVTQLPAPLHWSDNVANYMWDPTTPVFPINANAIYHILHDHDDRFPKELVDKDEVVLMDVIKKAATDGALIAARNPFYALPTYFKEHNEIGLMLPVYIPIIYGTKVVAALVLKKGATGYRVSTLLSAKSAAKSAALFCDPRNTWLKEEY